MGFILIAIIILAVFFLLMKAISSTLDKKEEVKNEKEKCNMKTCPNCGELNGDNNTTCYKCGNDISNISTVKRYCEYCKEIYAPKIKECPKCGMPTIEYDPITMSQVHNRKNAVEPWMYIVSFLIPIVGLVLGCIQVGKGDKTGARNLFITSIISIVLLAIIFAIRANKAEKELEDTVKDLQDQSSYSYNYDEYEW